jgi:hypothetical protein
VVQVNESNAAEAALAVKRGELPGPAKSLAEAVCRVMAAVGYVQKDKQMQGGGSYKYVSVEAVIDALRPEMIRQQLVLLPVGVDPLTLECFENKNGTRQNRTQVRYEFKLIHAASGQAEPVVVIGEAIDVGDKSSNKAMTAARKYALIMAFNIETGADPDDTPSRDQERAPARQPQPAPAKQPWSLRDQCATAIAGVRDRDGLTRVYRQYEADVKAGLFTPADVAALDVLFKETARKFPRPDDGPKTPAPAGKA